jgi:phosphoglycolate phosphatase
VTTDELAGLLANARALLLDFDGPICSVFAGSPADQLARQLRTLLPDHGEHLADLANPHEALIYATRFSVDVVRQVEAALHDGEVHAVATAVPTPGAHELITTAGIPIAVVSNNTSDAVRRYLTEHGYDPHVCHVEGRDPLDPGHMKPSPYLLQRAMEALRRPPNRCVLIGDSISDIEAAHSAGTRSIGYANRPGKLLSLTEAGADAAVTDLSTITELLTCTSTESTRWRP